MNEAKTRWVARHDGRKVGIAWRLPRNEGDSRDWCTQALTQEGYAVKTATLFYMYHEEYPGYTVVDCTLEDDTVVTMLETDFETA